MALPSSLGALRESIAAGRTPHRSVKDEMRANLIARVRAKQPLFPGIVGFDDTVMPQVVNAVLSRHNFILLGLRGQAKTRLLRALVELLDDEIPVVAGCEIHDDPDRAAVRVVPRARRHRRQRSVRRLAAARTPLRREAGDARRDHRRHDRRHRSDQSRAVGPASSATS